MSDSKLFRPEELIQMCRDFMVKKPATEPDADHEAWTGELRLTPRMVQDILDANTEI
jgi:hypothetical protein